MHEILLLKSLPPGKFSPAFLSSADFLQDQLFRKILSGIQSRVSNSLETDQAQLSVRPDLDPNCLQKLSADDTGDKEFTDMHKSLL